MTDLVERLRYAAETSRLMAEAAMATAAHLRPSWMEDHALLTEAADALSSREGGEGPSREVAFAGGWIPWPGRDGALPQGVEPGTLVDFRLSGPCERVFGYGDRTEFIGERADGWGWDRETCDPWITHWRMHDPVALSREGGEGVQHAPEVNHAKPLSTEAEATREAALVSRSDGARSPSSPASEEL